MIRRRGLYLIIGGFFYILISLVFCKRIYAKANEIKLVFSDYELVEDIDEMERSENSLLSDTKRKIIAYEDQNEQLFLNEEDQADDQNDQIGNNVSKDQEQNEEDMTNNTFEILVIFCFGLLAGVIAGNYLTGFIK